MATIYYYYYYFRFFCLTGIYARNTPGKAGKTKGKLRIVGACFFNRQDAVLLPNQQCQSIEGRKGLHRDYTVTKYYKNKSYSQLRTTHSKKTICQRLSRKITKKTWCWTFQGFIHFLSLTLETMYATHSQFKKKSAWSQKAIKSQNEAYALHNRQYSLIPPKCRPQLDQCVLDLSVRHLWSTSAPVYNVETTDRPNGVNTLRNNSANKRFI